MRAAENDDISFLGDVMDYSTVDAVDMEAVETSTENAERVGESIHTGTDARAHHQQKEGLVGNRQPESH